MKSIDRSRVLLADNDIDYRHSLRSLLELENYIVEEASSVEEAKQRLENTRIDIALADLRLTQDDDTADISGLEIAKHASRLHIPCIIITAFESVEVTRLALRARGAEPLAEDFIPKKYGGQAVLDALGSVLKNSRQVVAKISSNLQIDLNQGLVRNKGINIDLSDKQYTLVAYLYQKEGGVCTPEELLKAIYNEVVPAKQAMNDRRLKNLVDRVKQKIEDDPSKPKYLINVPGRGYRLEIRH